MPSVLVTGASRGIGKSVVRHLAGRGWDVIAGVRTETDADGITALDPKRISSVILDVTDAGHIAALDQSLPQRLDAVVNNAGAGMVGTIEEAGKTPVRKTMEVNYFSVV